MYFIIKTVISALLIAGISEIARRYSMLAAVLASVPLTSVLAMCWLYQETGSLEKVSSLSMAIFWLVIPSLLFFPFFSFFAKRSTSFYWSLAGALLVMVFAYFVSLYLLKKVGVETT